MECFSSPDALKDDTCGGTRIKQTRATPPESEPSVEQEAPLPNTELEFKFKLGKVEGEGEERRLTLERRPERPALEEGNGKDSMRTTWKPELHPGSLAYTAVNSFAGPQPAASSLWNGMIYPLRRMRFAGVVWYQGEANFMDPPGWGLGHTRDTLGTHWGHTEDVRDALTVRPSDRVKRSTHVHPNPCLPTSALSPLEFTPHTPQPTTETSIRTL